MQNKIRWLFPKVSWRLVESFCSQPRQNLVMSFLYQWCLFEPICTVSDHSDLLAYVFSSWNAFLQPSSKPPATCKLVCAIAVVKEFVGRNSQYHSKVIHDCGKTTWCILKEKRTPRRISSSSFANGSDFSTFIMRFMYSFASFSEAAFSCQGSRILHLRYVYRTWICSQERKNILG
jgi:hypothetical protein